MSDVFLAYKREDEQRVAWLRDAFVASDKSVWWDRQLAAGEQWRSGIERALADAACVVVVWSEHSVGVHGGFVRDEASRAAARGVLISVSFDGSTPPLGFGELHCSNLQGWKGSVDDPRFQDVLAAINAKKAGRAAPVGRWPGLKKKRQWLVALAAGLPAAAVVSLLMRQPLCELCRSSIGSQVCLRLLGHPALAARDEIKVLPQRVTIPRESSPTLGEAQKAAFDEGQRDARETVCAGFQQSQAFELVQASSTAERWDCMSDKCGFRCGFEGKASCTIRISDQPGSCE